MKRRVAAAAAAFALLLSACGRHGKDAGSVIRRRLDGEPKTLNPLLATTDPEQVVLALLARNLLDYDERLNLVPGLAEEIVSSPDHLTYTIRLRAGARWEDGTPVTADDVVFTLQTLVDPKTPSLNRKNYFEALDRVERVDEHTARAVFKKPYADQPDSFSLPLLPAASYRGTEVTTNPRNRAPLSNGPYRLAKWESGRSIELVRNTQYVGERPDAERVLFRLVPETASAFQALLSADLDETRLTYEQKKRIDADPGGPARCLVWDELAYTYIGWNNRLPLFSDARVRRALTMLVDRETLARTLYGGLAKPANGPIPPGLWSYDAALTPWPYDPKRAETLLDEAGWKKGPDGVRRKGSHRLAFPLSLGAGSDLQRQIVEFIQQAYRRAGIEMTIRPIEWSAFSAKADAGELEAWILAMNLDPNPDLALNWHSSQTPPNGLNAPFYVNPRVDALIDAIKVTFDREKAKELYREVQRIIHEDEPVTFLHVISTKWGIARRLENVTTSPIGLSLFWPGVAGWRVARATRPL